MIKAGDQDGDRQCGSDGSDQSEVAGCARGIGQQDEQGRDPRERGQEPNHPDHLPCAITDGTSPRRSIPRRLHRFAVAH